jgi:hypothetical protein
MPVTSEIAQPCPCCHIPLRLDDQGCFVIAEHSHADSRETRRLGGLKVIDATPCWRERSYLNNQQVQDQTHLTEFGFPSLTPSVQLDPLVQAAAEQDLKTKGIK